MGLMVDAHTWWRMGNKSYTPQVIRELARSMQKFNPYWLEEPFLPEDHLAYKKLKDDGYRSSGDRRTRTRIRGI